MQCVIAIGVARIVLAWDSLIQVIQVEYLRADNSLPRDYIYNKVVIGIQILTERCTITYTNSNS